MIFNDKKDEIYGMRKYAPLIVGIGKQENFISSDIVSFIDYTDNVIFLEDKEIVRVTSNSIEIVNFDGDKISRDKTHVAWEAADISKEEFSHHTIKEIHEQTSTVQNALKQDDEKFKEFVEKLKSGKNIFITGSGSSFHIALIFRKMLTKFVNSPVQAFLSSEAEEYIELMRTEDGLALIKDEWLNWKNGPMTEPSDIRPAQKELVNYITSWLKKNIK